MIIQSKKQLTGLVLENLPKYKLTNKYFKPVILNLLKKESLGDLLEINLIRYIAAKERVVQNFENYLNKKKKLGNIEEPILRLKSNFKSEYYSVLAELESAKKLKKAGMKNIKFLPPDNNPDIQFEEGGVIRYAEVKNLMEINPEITIVDNIFEAKSLRNKLFQRLFIIDCEYSLIENDNIAKLHDNIRTSAKQLVKILEKKLKMGNIDHEFFQFKPIDFTITTKDSNTGYHALFTSGNPIVFSSVDASFLDFYSVYIRLIQQFRKGYLQLLKKRSNDKLLVKQDRMYIYLNLGRGSSFIKKAAKRIFIKMARAIGMSELVNLKIQL